MENRLLTQYNSVITSQWLSKQIEEAYESLIPRELFEIAYHTCNSVGVRNIYIKLCFITHIPPQTFSYTVCILCQSL